MSQDQNNQSDDFMNASAESWSKDENSHLEDEFSKASAEEWSKPESVIENLPGKEETDRWGSPIQKEDNIGNQQESNLDDEKRPPVIIDSNPQVKGKKRFPWWAIVLIILGALCLCSAVVVPIVLLSRIF